MQAPVSMPRHRRRRFPHPLATCRRERRVRLFLGPRGGPGAVFQIGSLQSYVIEKKSVFGSRRPGGRPVACRRPFPSPSTDLATFDALWRLADANFHTPRQTSPISIPSGAAQTPLSIPPAGRRVRRARAPGPRELPGGDRLQVSRPRGGAGRRRVRLSRAPRSVRATVRFDHSAVICQ